MIQDPRTTIEDTAGAQIEITDAELRALSALDKVSIMKKAISQAVENILGLDLKWHEKVLIIAYRDWLESPKSASGVFHYRVKPAAEEEEKIDGFTE